MSLTPETRARILEAAWAHVVARGSVDIRLAEVARAAGVSRQSVYLAFGNRVGLMIAMARHADRQSEHSRRMAALADGPGNDPATFVAFVEAWLAHLPEIYPVGVLLGAAAVTDPEAAEVFSDRMVGGLLRAYRTVLDRLAAAGHLAAGWTSQNAADFAWSLTHLDAWRHLVVELGWTPEAFRENRITTLQLALFGR